MAPSASCRRPPRPVKLPPSALAALSAAVLLLILLHRRANLGGRAAFSFVAAAAVYGFVRSATIRALAEAKLGGAPYTLSAPLATIWGVPLQELLGWTVATGLAGYLADRWLRRCRQPADAYATALVAGLGMAAVCLAVESAAVTGGWWTWSLAHDPGGRLPFPGIGLVDWGFVALDFLLPFELWRRRAPLGRRLAALLIFPLHLLGRLHRQAARPGAAFGLELVHVGLVAAAIAAAAVARDRSPWPAFAEERERFLALAAAILLLATTSTQLLLGGRAALLWIGLPLLLLAERRRSAGGASPRSASGCLSRRQASLLFALLLVLGFWPYAYRKPGGCGISRRWRWRPQPC